MLCNLKKYLLNGWINFNYYYHISHYCDWLFLQNKSDSPENDWKLKNIRENVEYSWQTLETEGFAPRHWPVFCQSGDSLITHRSTLHCEQFAHFCCLSTFSTVRVQYYYYYCVQSETQTLLVWLRERPESGPGTEVQSLVTPLSAVRTYRKLWNWPY